jgi:hypothetical protein
MKPVLEYYRKMYRDNIYYKTAANRSRSKREIDLYIYKAKKYHLREKNIFRCLIMDIL